LPIADCRLPIVDCRLPIADCRLLIADRRLAALTLCRVSIAHWRGQSSMFNLQCRQSSIFNLQSAIGNR
jgi:hypothetical protein